jgi:hypothetical protein
MKITRGRAAALASALLALGFAGCDDGGGGGAADAGDGGEDAGWESPIDGSVWGLDAGDEQEPEPDCECADPVCGIEYTCYPGVKDCLCDNVCDSVVYAAQGWGPYLQTYRCYEPCTGGAACSRADDVCTDLASTGGPELCLPRISAEAGEFDIKVTPQGSDFSIVDAAQVDVQLLVDGEERHLVMAFAMATSGPPAIELVFMEPGVGDYYYLDVYIFQDFWAPGTVELTTTGTYELDARLYLISDEMWIVAQALTGTIELVETTDPSLCDGPGCPKTIVGSVSLDLYGLEAEFEEN